MGGGIKNQRKNKIILNYFETTTLDKYSKTNIKKKHIKKLYEESKLLNMTLDGACR